MKSFNKVNIIKTWCYKVLPLVYDDSLSYYEVLNKMKFALNEVIENTNNLPDYIADLIENYITSGEIDNVVRNILANYILNVKYPPKGITPAIGDGSSDDTEAIQGCIDYAEANGYGVVYFPYGKYLSGPITLKSNVGLYGFDRYSTIIVLKGGANNSLLNGNVEGVSIANLTLDGNGETQVNNIDLINLELTNALFYNLICKDSYNLMKLNSNTGLIQISNLYLENSFNNSFECSGNSKFYLDNVVTNSIYNNIQKSFIINSNNGYYNITINEKTNIGIVINGNKNYINACIENATINYEDNGSNNNIIINGKSIKYNLDENFSLKAENYIETISGDKTLTAGDISNNAYNITDNVNETYNISSKIFEILCNETISLTANDIVLKPTNPLTYKTPENLNNAFNYIPFKDGENNIYKILVDKGYKMPTTILNVLDFGVKGDGETDDTIKINECLTKAKELGACVYFPSGKYVISQITLLTGVSIFGNLVNSGYGNNGGSWFYPIDETKDSIIMQDGTLICGFGFYYPKQVYSNAPLVYKSAICADENNTSPILPGGNHPKRNMILNCYFINPYIAIDFSKAHDLLTIENVQGYAIYKGIIIDNSYDSDTLINVHFNNNALANTDLENWEKYRDWTRNNGICFNIGKADWINLIRSFCWGYYKGCDISKIGETAPGVVRFTACGFDSCGTCCEVNGDNFYTEGISFDNCMFYANKGLTDNALTNNYSVVLNTCRNVQFSNCLFGNTEKGGIYSNNVNTAINNCVFNNLATISDGVAIYCEEGSVNITGCTIIGAENTKLKGIVIDKCNLIVINSNNFLLMGNDGITFLNSANNANALGNSFSTTNSANDFVLNDLANYLIERTDKSLFTSGNVNATIGNYTSTSAKNRVFKAVADAEALNNTIYMTDNGVLKFKDYNSVSHDIVIIKDDAVEVNNFKGINSVLSLRNFIAITDESTVVNNSLFMDSNGVLKFKDKDGVVKNITMV